MIISRNEYEFSTAVNFLMGDGFRKEIDELTPDFLDFINNEDVKKEFMLNKLKDSGNEYSHLFEYLNNAGWSDEDVINWFLGIMEGKFVTYYNNNTEQFVIFELEDG